MPHWIDVLLKAASLYSHVCGVSNFEFDWQTGRVYTTARSTLFAIANNGSILVLLVFYLNTSSDFASSLNKANKLVEYVIVIMTGLRIAAGVLTVLNRWSQRSELKNLVRNVMRLILARPQVIYMSRWGILLKFFTGFTTDLLHMALTLEKIIQVDSGLFACLCLQFWMATIMTLALSQHYLVLLIARAEYHLLNTELRHVIDESIDLSSHRPRKGTFMTRCCHLADQLEDVGKVQSLVQAIIIQLGETFAIQGVMVYSGYYLTSVAISYLTYSNIKNGYENIGQTRRDAFLTITWCFFYYLDALINLLVMLKVQDDHKKMRRLLEERTLFASGLDVRLEETFESLQLQLIRNPLNMEVMKLFRVTRGTTIAMCGSLILHSILLIQFDMEYF